MMAHWYLGVNLVIHGANLAAIGLKISHDGAQMCIMGSIWLFSVAKLATSCAED